jgi:hypothetical protein
MTRDDQVREQLLNVVRVLQPYARSQGRFSNLDDLRTAIKLALQYLERAELLLPPRW